MLLKTLVIFCFFWAAPLFEADIIRCDRSSDSIEYELRAERSGLFGRVFVVDRDGQRYLRFGDACGADQSSIDLGNRDHIIVEYVRNASLGFLFPENIGKVLVVGMGGGVFSNMVLERMPNVTVDSIEIDPVVVELAKEYFDIAASVRHRIIVADAVDHLESSEQRYDYIFLDAYDSDGIPEALSSIEFFGKVVDRLTPGGVIVANFGLDEPRVYLQLASRLETVTGHVLCVHGVDEPNLVVIASRSELAIREVNRRFVADDQLLSRLRSCPRI